MSQGGVEACWGRMVDSPVGSTVAPAHPAHPAHPVIGRRNQERFEALALPCADVLFATAFRLTGDRTRAEDLVQDTLYCAWDKFPSFQDGTNFRAWVFRILILQFRNEHRATRKQPVPLVDDAMAGAAPEQAERVAIPNVTCDWRALYASLVDDEFKRALDNLDANHRTALMLVTLAELSYQECADALGVPVGTVMSWIHRARKQLQAELMEYARARGLVKSRRAVSEEVAS